MRKRWIGIGAGGVVVAALATGIFMHGGLQVSTTPYAEVPARMADAPMDGTKLQNVSTQQEGMTIHVQWKDKEGSYPHLAYKNVNGNEASEATTNPGVPMKNDGNGWYSYTIPKAESAEIQVSVPDKGFYTSSQKKSGDDWWFAQGSWFKENPAPEEDTEFVEVDDAKQVATDAKITVHCYSDGDTPNIYYWNAMPVDLSTQWPGEAMKDEGAGWYSYTFDKTDKINVLFVNGSKQSEDFKATEGEWWYTGSEWTQKDPTGGAATQKPATPKPTDRVVVTPNPDLADNDFREESIYFVMTTRFFDGDPSNNVHCQHDAEVGNGDDDPAWRGDFKGLIEKLDYIKALGFSAVWVTPVVENASEYDFHGYHALDFKKVDPRYESSDTSYQDLINACHEKGMKLIQDVVFQHTSSYGEQGLCDLFDQEYVLDKGVSGNSVTRKVSNAERLDKYVAKACRDNSNKNGIGTIPEYTSYASIPEGKDYTGPVTFTAREYAMREDPTYRDKQKYGSFSWEDFSVTTGQIDGNCQELNTEKTSVYNYIIDAYEGYMDMGVDAFRIDTVKHMSRLTMNETFLPAFTSYAKKIGRDNFYMFGEVASRVNDVFQRDNACVSPFYYTWKEEKDYGWNHNSEDGEDNIALTKKLYEDTPRQKDNYHRYSSNAFLDGNNYKTPDYSESNGLNVIDYTMHFNFKRATEAYSRGLEEDRYVNDSTWSVMYVESHDYGAQDDNGNDKHRYEGGTEAWAENMDLMWTFRGIPCLYYGGEIEFKKGVLCDNYGGALEDSGRAYFGDHIEGSVSVTDFGQYKNATGAMATTLSKPLCQHLMKLNRIRRAVPALQKGQYSTEGCNGTMAFKRRYTDSASGIDSYVLVAISGDATFSGVLDGEYVDLVTGDKKTVTGGSLKVSCPGKANLRVYVLQNGTADAYGATGKIGDTTTYLK